MIIQNVFPFPSLSRMTLSFNSGKNLGKYIFLIYLFGFLPIKLFSQPIANGKSKFLGSAYSNQQAQFFESYWNQVTPENGGKWGSVEGTRNQMNWGSASTAYDFAKSKGFKFRYHVLVWGNQQPNWIEDLEPTEQLEEIEEWFAAVAAQYPNIDYLEVVNEPLHDPPDEGDGGYIDALGGSDSLYGTGWDWIIKSFELAKQYFPDSTKLMINDYSIINSDNNTTEYLEIINLLIDRNLIDGIGIQAHAFSTRFASAATIKNNLDRLGETGLPIQVCEMDVDGKEDQTQLDEYRRIFPLFWEHPSVEGITLWGWRRGLWRDDFGAYLLDDRGAPRPALEWMRTYVDNPITPEPMTPVIISPDIEIDVPRNPILLWHQTDSTTSYHIQLSKNSTFSTFIIDSSVTDTLLQLDILEANTSFYWRVRAINEYGTSEYSAKASFITGDNITDIKEVFEMPKDFKLFQNYPNPFNPSTSIKYFISQATIVTLDVYDMLGQNVQSLVNSKQSPGQYTVIFDGSNLSSGTYFYRFVAGSFVDVKQILLIK